MHIVISSEDVSWVSNIKDITYGIFNKGDGAQFIVSKDKILKHDIDFYKKIMSLLDTDSKPIGAYVMQRLWGVIFNYDKV